MYAIHGVTATPAPLAAHPWRSAVGARGSAVGGEDLHRQPREEQGVKKARERGRQLVELACGWISAPLVVSRDALGREPARDQRRVKRRPIFVNFSHQPPSAVSLVALPLDIFSSTEAHGLISKSSLHPALPSFIRLRSLCGGLGRWSFSRRSWLFESSTRLLLRFCSPGGAATTNSSDTTPPVIPTTTPFAPLFASSSRSRHLQTASTLPPAAVGARPPTSPAAMSAFEVGTRAWQPDPEEGWVASEVIEKKVDGDRVTLVFKLANGEVCFSPSLPPPCQSLTLRPVEEDARHHCRSAFR